MADDGYPSVYVVDSHVTRPSVPPRLNQRPKRAGVAQTLLFLLVSMALCGMAIEACFIYRLYQTESANSPSSSKMIGDEDAIPTKKPINVHPSKPVAHLTEGSDVVYKPYIMTWSTNADPLLYEMNYENGELITQKEGYYYVYSKVNFVDDHVFHHAVELKTARYTGKSITLLQSRKYSESQSIKIRSNSFLGGVFHLYKGDAIFVKVSNTSKIVRHKSFENIFGAYMI